MKKILLNILFFNLLILTNAWANHPCNLPHKQTYKEQKQIDILLNDRLHLTQEQKDYIKENRQKHKKELEQNIEKLHNIHTQIRNVYLTGIPKWQADIRTAHLKSELAIVKQKIDKQKNENRKNFENILSEEQKLEFEKIKKEFASKKPCNH